MGKGHNMTYKNGALAGFGAGFVALLFLQGYIVFTPNPQLVKNLLLVIGAGAFAASVVLGILYVFRGKATLGTTVDGFIYGFMVIFDILYLFISLIHGNLPFSFESIILIN